MSGLSFKLDAFEGPLDLLLHLITKHKLNIYDIEIALLLDQYMEYINSIEEQDFDAAGDFLAMAARLVYIKTCSLLPQAEEAEELKKELQGDLLEYSVCKQAAMKLREVCVYGDVFVRPPEKIPVNKTFTGTIDPQKLVDAYMGMTAKARSIKPVRAERFSPIVAARFVTVTSKIVFVLKKLYQSGECTMDELYFGIDDKSARVATFLAVLELTKSGRIFLNDDNSLIKFNRESKRRHTKNKEPVTSKEEISDIIDESAVSDKKIEDFEEKDTDTEPQTVECFHETALPSYESHELEESVPAEDKSDLPIPFENEQAVSVSSNREKYALEQRVISHMLVVPVCGEKEVANDNIDNADIVSKIETAEPTQPAKDGFSIKINRFSSRYRWGYPEFADNCWIYGKERL